MIFNSVTFIIFLMLIVAFYWHMPRRARLYTLLLSSIIFYGFWNFAFVPLMLFSVSIDYVASKFIASSKRINFRKLILSIAVGSNLSLLGFFKYYYFFDYSISGLGSLYNLEIILPQIDILLPIGISFYTFQSISYTVDVYRREIDPVDDFVLFANYVTFFPQLIAGPILRAREVIWQLDTRPRFELDNLIVGTKRIICGLFLKVVLADNLSPIVDDIYDQDLEYLGAIDVMTMAFLFGFQIYFDFAAYSHIALGSARLMGIKFPENFHFPYSASSPREFWRRWHISLSSWIKDYVYIPMMGRLVGERSTKSFGNGSSDHLSICRRVLVLFATWALMGLWHGAGWAFVLWGLWHATLIQVYRASGELRQRIPQTLRRLGGWAITLPLVMLSWIPFRTQSVEETLMLWSNLFVLSRWQILGLRENNYLIAFLILVLVLLAPIAKEKIKGINDNFPSLGIIGEILTLSLVFSLVFVFLRPVEQFIYFQF